MSLINHNKLTLQKDYNDMTARRLRRTIIGLQAASMLLFLAACGTPAATSTATTGASAATTAGANAATSVNADASLAASSATRLVKHAMGETNVPVNPQRVVVLDTGELDSVLALGIKPVGAVEALAGEGFQEYFGDQTQGITNVGTIAEPNLETILTLKPDLILSNKVRHEDIYQQLSEIAPTVFAERVGVVWKENFMLAGEALNKTAEAERLMQAYDARIRELQTNLGDQAAQTTVSVIRFLPEQLRLYQKGSFIGTILEDVGFARPESQSKTDETWLEGNKERITDLDGDVMFVTSYGPADKTVMDSFRNDPLWSQLEVVKQNKVYDVSDDHWMLGIGVLAANRVIDDLNTYLVQP